jgi:hypothetical protein
MDKVAITKEMILAASDYITNASKEAWVSETAPKCFDRLAITADGETMPEMYMVNTGLKSRYLMTALVSLYFGHTYEADETDDALISEADYDKWAAGHVFCQIDRWKHDVEVRDKCYDMLYDYHDLEKRFSSQVVGLLNVQNDEIMRQSRYMGAQLKQLPQLIAELKELQANKGEETDGD